MIATNGLYTVYLVAGIIIAVPAALAIVWGVVKVVGHLQGVHEAIIGKPGTKYSDPVPSIIDRFKSVDDHFAAVDAHLAQQDEDLRTIRGELSFNGGQSVKDRVARLDGKMEQLKTGQTEIKQGQEDAAREARQ